MLDYITAGWGWQFANAFGVSLTAAVFSFVFSMLIGIACTLLSRSRFPGGAVLVNIYTYVFRSLPDILLLILIFYTIDALILSVTSFAFGQSDVRVGALLPAIVSTSIILGAYATELFKAGWADIPKGQYEAGHALGLTGFQSLVLVVLPQVYRKIVPHLGSLWLIAMKESALLSIIGISDIVRVSSIGARSTGDPFVFYGVGIAVFVTFAILSSRVFHALEQRAQVSSRGI